MTRAGRFYPRAPLVAPVRRRADRRRVPKPLAALLGAVLALGLTWALLVPPAEVADEPVHFAYAQTLAETGHRARPDVGTTGRNVYSTEQLLARRSANYEAPISRPSVKPEWRASAFERWRNRQAKLPPGARRDGGASNSAAGNPPLYYAWEAIAYRLAGGDLFTRWYAMRVWSMLLLGVAVAATWLLAGEIAGRNRLAQVAAAAFVGLQPGASAISAGINPDGAMIAAWAVVMWLGVRLLRRGLSGRGVAALLAATVAALLIKATSFALVPAVAIALAVAARRALHRRPRPAAVAAAVLVTAGGVAAVILTGAADRLSSGLRGEGHPTLHGFLSYMWQAYLPNLPFQTEVLHLAPFWGYDVWIKSAWGNFGWAELLLPAVVYGVIGVACVAILAAGGFALFRARHRVDWAAVGFLGAAAAALVIGLHVAEYRQFLEAHLSLLQGRYLLPLLPLGGLALAAALTLLPRRGRPIALSCVLVALFALQLFSLGIVVGRFYA